MYCGFSVRSHPLLCLFAASLTCGCLSGDFYFSAQDLPQQPDERLRIEHPDGASFIKPQGWEHHTIGCLNSSDSRLYLQSRRFEGRRIYGAFFIVQPDDGLMDRLGFEEYRIGNSTYNIARESQPGSGELPPKTSFHFKVVKRKPWRITFVACTDLQEVPMNVLLYIDTFREEDAR